MKVKQELARFILVASLTLFIAGCYTVNKEVIRTTDAVSIYNLPGKYYYDDGGGELMITAIPNCNDYRFQTTTYGGKTRSGYLRLVPLRDDIYIVQARYDDENCYYMQFNEFTSDRRFMPLDVDGPVFNLAEEHDVTVEWDDYSFVPVLGGKQTDILAFLRAHKYVSLCPSEQ